MSERKPQNQEKYIVRFPDGMRDQLKKFAEEAGRSLNAEIIHRLATSLKNNGVEDRGFSLKVPDGLTLTEDLDWLLLTEADKNGRTVREEIEQRIYDSFQNQDDLLRILSWRYFTALEEVEKAQKSADMINYLTPSERLLLEERIQDINNYRKTDLASQVADFHQNKHILTKKPDSGEDD